MAKTVLQILNENISNPSVFFVFPTQVAADSWADALLDSLGTGTIALERFTAWDSFKGSAIRSQKQDKTSIPSVMRKMFAARIIEKNNALVTDGRQPLFNSLIKPEYAHLAGSFTNWIASLLPQLILWKKQQKAALSDPEDQDLERLYEAYRDFLEEKKLFDPAWETPPFDARGNQYIIFYPEILEDFAEYQELLEESPFITLVKADDLESLSKDTDTFIRTFDNSRAELHALALEIQRSHKDDGIPFEDMAISIDRDGLLLPYIERELAMYSIPVNCRVAKSLTSRGVGLLFPQIEECVTSHFSFDSVKDLLLNNELPWKKKQLNMDLINFGIRNSCICSFEKNGTIFDVWQDAFKAFPQETLLSTFYNMLKKNLEKISRAKTFKEIEDAYFAFRSEFFDAENFSEQANNVLGRCIKELAELIRIQTDYPDMQIENCFSFFTQHLASTEYLAQSASSGVVLYPYRNAAAAPKVRHFVPAAGQDAVTITYSPLRFLSAEKRARLGVEDTDVSAVFLKMYSQNSSAGTWFSCAEKSFAGYTLPHSALTSKKDSVPQSDDFISEQRTWLSGQSAAFPATVSEIDKAGFANWSSSTSVLSSPDTALSAIAREKLFEGDSVRVSESALNDFFFCPRKWYYARCLKLKPFTLEADLMDDVWVGTLYHKILETFFLSIKNSSQNKIFNPDKAGTYDNYLKLTDIAVETGIQAASGSPLSKTLLKKQKDAYFEKAKNCIMEFCSLFYGCSIVDAEKELSMNPDGKSYLLTGKIDLILRDNEGRIILIDFKTGSSPSKVKCFPDPDDENRLQNFQFAMYIKLWEHEHPDPDDRVFECHFFEIGECSKKTIVGKTLQKEKNREDMDASISLLDTYADIYAGAITRKTLEAGIQPTFKDCSGCTYKTICRSTYSVSGDTSLTAAQKETDNDE